MRAAGASRTSGLIEVVTTWVCRGLALTLQWWAQVLAGGVVAGIAPATLTLYRQVRIALDDQVLRGYYRESWRYWRAHLLRAQPFLLAPLLTVVVLWFYLRVAAGTAAAIPLTALSAVYLCWLMLLPAWLTADGDGALAGARVLPTWGRAWQLLAIGALPCLLAGVIAGTLVAAGLWWAPGVVPLFAPVLVGLLAMIAARRTRERVEAARRSAGQR